jgi:hypothetical protein
MSDNPISVRRPMTDAMSFLAKYYIVPEKNVDYVREVSVHKSFVSENSVGIVADVKHYNGHTLRHLVAVDLESDKIILIY